MRSAFSGSSGSARSVPQVTIMPSPRYLSTVPPKRSTIGTKSSKTAYSSRVRSRSEMCPSEVRVKPRRSRNSTVAATALFSTWADSPNS